MVAVLVLFRARLEVDVDPVARRSRGARGTWTMPSLKVDLDRPALAAGADLLELQPAVAVAPIGRAEDVVPVGDDGALDPHRRADRHRRPGRRLRGGQWVAPRRRRARQCVVEGADVEVAAGSGVVGARLDGIRPLALEGR